MVCQNCGSKIHPYQSYYRAGKNGSVFCRRLCIYEAYQGYYTDPEVERTVEELKKAP